MLQNETNRALLIPLKKHPQNHTITSTNHMTDYTGAINPKSPSKPCYY